MRLRGDDLAGLLHRRWMRWAAVGLVAVLALTGILVWRGVPTQQTELEQTSVWSINSRGPLYGRVDTDITELAQVHSGDPSAFRISTVLQDGSSVVLLSDQQRMKVVDPGDPQDVEDAKDATSAPLDADAVVPSGPYVAFLNRRTGALGAIAVSDLAAGGSPTAINERDGDVTERFVAAAVTAQGVLYGLSDRGEIVTWDVAQGEQRSRKGTDAPTDGDSDDLTVFGDHWALLQHGGDTSTLWVDGQRTEVSLDANARLARADADADELAVADGSGLHLVDARGAETGSVDATGTAAAPVWRDGCLHAAWGASGAMSVSDCGGDAQSLEFPSASAASGSSPIFRVNGDGFVLNDGASGLVWELDGDTWRLVPSSTSWQREDDQRETTDTKQDQNAKQNECPTPAIGASAEFGVRPGQLATVPVLVGALDPNPQDTITIVSSADSPKWSSGGFGTLAAVNDDQAVSLQPDVSSGSGTISYVITDGSDCRVTGEAQVSVHPEDVNAAPEYRAVNDRSLADLQVAPGGSLRFNGLDGWVDPDGDPLYVTGATATAGTAAATPQGMVAYKADEDQAAGRVTVTVEVSDGRGGTTRRDIGITVTDSPLLKARSFARTVTVGSSPAIDLSEYISGVAGGGVENTRVDLARATVDGDLQSRIAVRPSTDSLSVSVTPVEAGVYPITYEVRSGASTATGTLLVTATADDTRLSTPPITVFLRPDEDVTVDPLAPVSNPSGSVLMVGDGQEYQLDDSRSSLSASAVGGSELRVTGRTPDGSPGRIGTFTYAVTDGSQTVTGLATVFQIDDAVSAKPVAVADQVTVRAGGQVDIPVLDNDVAPAGGTLMLDPRQTTDDLPGLAFPSGSSLRYLATTEPGSYTLTYRTYVSGHPGQGSFGRVTVRVTADDGNQAPEATNIDARVQAHSSTMISVPGYGVDPDGDDVSVVSVTQPDANGSAQVLSDGRIEVASTADGGPISFDYTVADARGATSTATVRVGVITDATLAPVAYNDYVEATPGTESVAVDPTLNDTRVGDESLEVESVDQVVSSLASDGAAGMPADVDGNTVTLRPSAAVGRTVYQYAVRSAGGSTAVGSIVLNVTNDALPQYPQLVDTQIGADDIDGDDYSADVVSDRLIWSGSGKVDVALWGDQDGVSLDGDTVSGTLGDSRRIIPISATAEDAQGQTDPPRTWAFVRVPKKDTIRPQLKDPAKTYEVHENESVTVDLADEIGQLSGRTLQVNAAKASGSRPEASCTVSGTSVTYAAGGDSTSERDSCGVEVQWAGDDGTRSTVSLPMRIVLDDPPPVIRSAQIAVVDPAETGEANLADSVDWTGDKGTLGYECGQATGAKGVTVACSGGQVSIMVAPDAQQGSVASFDVRITSPSFTPVPQARMTVQVGTLAPATLDPAGLSLELSEGSGSGSVDALGPNGSVSRYTPVKLTEVSFSDAGVSGSVNGSSIQVQVAQGTQGGVKSGTYTLEDAQGNTGHGRIEVDYRALPNKPARVALSSVGDGTVTLAIEQSETLSSPAVTGFHVTWEGGSQDCGLGACTISGLKNFDHKTFVVAAVNDVGQSRDTVSVEGWAYRKPGGAPRLDWRPSAAGEVTVTVTNPDTDGVSGIVLDGPGGARTLAASGGEEAFDVAGGSSAQITATSTGQEKPAVDNVSARDTAVSQVTVEGVEAPVISEVSAQASGPDAVTGSATITARGGDVRYGWALDGEACSAAETLVDGSVTVTRQAASNIGHTLTLCAAAGLPDGQTPEWAQGVSSPSPSVTPIAFPGDDGGVAYRIDPSTGSVSLTGGSHGDFTAELVTGSGPTRGSHEVSYRWRFTDGTVDQTTHQAGPSGTPAYVPQVGSGWNATEVTHAFADSNAWTYTLPTLSVEADSDDYETLIRYCADAAEACHDVPSGQSSVSLPDVDERYTFTWTVRFTGDLAGLPDRTFTKTVITQKHAETPETPESTPGTTAPGTTTSGG